MQGICPVCCQGIVEAGGARGALVREHDDNAGKLCPMSGEPMPAWDEKSTRRAVAARSGGICEFCRRARGADMHHRQSRGVGGRWHPANILHLCRACHGRATREPTWAHAYGLRCDSTEAPTASWCQREDGELWLPSDLVTAEARLGR